MNIGKGQQTPKLNNKLTEPVRQMTEKQWQAQMDANRKEQLAQIGARLSVLRNHFAILVDQVTEEIYSAMETNGFWAGEQDNFGSKTALVHSELSEMLEANRKDVEADDKVPDYTGEEAEAADALIRLFDMAGRYQWRLGEAVIDKMLYNLSRPYKHGKKY